MTIRFQDKWIWDFWFAQDGPDTHIFYLQAPRALKKESLRHWNVSVGHAVSQDLIHWTILPDALAPSDIDGAWDDYTTWTGSIIRHAGTWYMFYTGTNHAQSGKIQRIGLCTSDDLMHWKRYSGGALIEADSNWYELYDPAHWYEQTWRDPWVFAHDGKFHAYITARCKTGPIDARGVIGHAVSSDLISWEVCPPVTEPGEFGFLEVPQLVEINRLWYLFFSITHEKYSNARLNRPGVKPQTGTHYMIAEHPLGPFRYMTDDFLVGDEIGSLYAARAIRDFNMKWSFMAFEHFTSDGSFIGTIADPFPLDIQPDGTLLVSLSRERKK